MPTINEEKIARLSASLLMERQELYFEDGREDKDYDYDKDVITMMVTDSVNNNWDEADIMNYVRSSEYVNPILDEAIAINRMAKINAKYR